MGLSKKKVIAESNRISSCIQFAKEIDKIAKLPKNIAILSNFTIQGLAECLKTKSFIHDIFLNIYEGEYGQWQQEILNNKFYQFKPDIIFLFLDLYGLDQDISFHYNEMSAKKLKEIKEEKANELLQFINHLKDKTKAKIIISNAVKNWPPVMGIFDHKLSKGINKIIDDYNNYLLENFQDDKQVFIFNFNEWLGHIGKRNFWYDKYFFMADMKLSPEAFPMLAEEWMSFLIPLAGKKKKCLVLDLDNTLWGGIIGEDGLAGIKLAPTGEGQQYYYFQKLLLSLSKRGIMLAINSKNNKEDAKEVFAKHPHMILKESDFLACRINWDNKAKNMQELAQELNIGLESMVFIDDDPVNRELIRETLPEVTVLDLPTDSTQYLRTLLDYKGFNTFEFTEEDKKRSKMYLQEKKRKEFQGEVIDIDSFLKGLNLRISIKTVTDLLIPRSAQLTQKTNQFNLTTYRYQEEDIKKFIEEGHKLWVLDVADKFGEYGITGLCIAKDLEDKWEIDTMLLSCRILGKKIEEQFFGFILDELKKIKAKSVLACYKPTVKNSQVRDFYNSFNFKKIKSADNEDVWQCELVDFVFKPHEFIEIIDQ
ncbi:HAD-IIIC family phosphatase [Patescibacteria group bacterium]|nr:HAD-IIIC family phosphatase [Patescibacteria group bacterium]